MQVIDPGRALCPLTHRVRSYLPVIILMQGSRRRGKVATGAVAAYE